MPKSPPIRLIRSSMASRPVRIQSVGRLVEQQQPGIADERLRQLDPLLHAGRVGTDLAVALLVEADVPERLGGTLLGRGGGHVRTSAPCA